MPGVSASYVAFRQLRISDDFKDVDQYRDIAIKVKNWGIFERSDIERNQIRATPNTATIPNYVTTFEQMLTRKPVIRPNVRRFPDLSLCCSILTGQCR